MNHIKKRSALHITSILISLLFAAFLLSITDTQSFAAGTNEYININTATVKQLTKLPGIGKKKGEAITKYRKENGPFKSVEEVQKVKGIGSKLYKKIKELLTLEEKPAGKTQ